MDVEKTSIEGVVIIKPHLFEDARGYFFESFSQRDFDEKVRPIRFVQDNESKSGYGVVRGLHFQADHEQQQNHPELRGMKQVVRIPHQLDAKRSDQHPHRQIAQHRPKPRSLEKGDEQNGRQQQRGAVVGAAGHQPAPAHAVWRIAGRDHAAPAPAGGAAGGRGRSVPAAHAGPDH